MKSEHSRQAVHLSGVAFVALSYYASAWSLAAYSFVVAAGLLVYAIYFRMERSRLQRLLEKAEAPLRKALLHLENRPQKSPRFSGAFWFFFSIGITLLIFPIDVARAAILILAVGDSISTLVGCRLGRHRLLGTKTVEGSLSFLLASLSSVALVPIHMAIVAALIGTAAELLPEVGALEGMRTRGVVNDNFLIPILAGSAMLLMGM